MVEDTARHFDWDFLEEVRKKHGEKSHEIQRGDPYEGDGWFMPLDSALDFLDYVDRGNMPVGDDKRRNLESQILLLSLVESDEPHERNLEREGAREIYEVIKQRYVEREYRGKKFVR